jgi:anti-sigma B factor antagonist
MGPGSLQIDVATTIEGSSVRVAGEIDLAGAPEVTRAVEAALAPGVLIELDLRAVEFMDSSGVAALTRCRRLAEDAGGGLVVRCMAHGAVAQLIEWTGLAQVVDIRFEPPTSSR